MCTGMDTTNMVMDIGMGKSLFYMFDNLKIFVTAHRYRGRLPKRSLSYTD